MLLPIIFSYAEIHYHLKKLFPLYYKKFPEIIADIPTRAIIKENTFPLLIIIKDSHLFPVYLKKICVIFQNQSLNSKIEVELKRNIESPYFSKVIHIPVDETISGNVTIDVEIHVKNNGKTHVFINDNYDLSYKPFKCFVSRDPLPYPQDWFSGDVHYHSNYTDDQVEFGADIPATIEMAKALGLDWFFVTDHSYDLDDSLTDFTKNDSDFPKWKKLQKEIIDLEDKDVKVIAGEEVSIGNHKENNVHLLAVNHLQFIEGKGDGAENWFHNKPTTFIKDIAPLHSSKNLFIAAHPWENVPFLQKLTLRRDNWHLADFDEGNISYIQIVNGESRSSLRKSIRKWSEILLSNRKIFIVAGNDAHGNFNIMRQIKIPFIRLFSVRKQTFGLYHTVYKHHENDPIAGLKKGVVIVSNGPFLDFSLKNRTEEFSIGSKVKKGSYKLSIKTATSIEFGDITSVKLFLGDLKKGSEEIHINPEAGFELELDGTGYIRMELETELGGIVVTNPIWFGN